MYIACVDLFLLELLVNTDSMNQNIYNCRAVFFFLLCRPTHREQALLKASLSTPISSVQPMCRYIQSDLTMRGL